MVYPWHLFPQREMLPSGDDRFSNLACKEKKKQPYLPVHKGTIFTHLE